VRFEGWTTDDWLRFLRLWQPRATADKESTRPRGGVIVVHEDGEVLKLLHTRLGRLDPATGAPPPSQAGARALALSAGHPSALGTLARAHHASWALAMRLGALDEVMERLGARVRRGDDLTAQSLLLVGIARDMIAEGAIASWPQRLRGIPVPTPQVVRRTLDALCADGRAIALGLFDAEGLWTAFVARRRGPACGRIWRRCARHIDAQHMPGRSNACCLDRRPGPPGRDRARARRQLTFCSTFSA